MKYAPDDVRDAVKMYPALLWAIGIAWREKGKQLSVEEIAAYKEQFNKVSSLGEQTGKTTKAPAANAHDSVPNDTARDDRMEEDTTAGTFGLNISLGMTKAPEAPGAPTPPLPLRQTPETPTPARHPRPALPVHGEGSKGPSRGQGQREQPSTEEMDVDHSVAQSRPSALPMADVGMSLPSKGRPTLKAPANKTPAPRPPANSSRNALATQPLATMANAATSSRKVVAIPANSDVDMDHWQPRQIAAPLQVPSRSNQGQSSNALPAGTSKRPREVSQRREAQKAKQPQYVEPDDDDDEYHDVQDSEDGSDDDRGRAVKREDKSENKKAPLSGRERQYHRSSVTRDQACDRCTRLEQMCYEQVGITGGACYGCSKVKMRCQTRGKSVKKVKVSAAPKRKARQPSSRRQPSKRPPASKGKQRGK